MEKSLSSFRTTTTENAKNQHFNKPIRFKATPAVILYTRRRSTKILTICLFYR